LPAFRRRDEVWAYLRSVETRWHESVQVSHTTRSGLTVMLANSYGSRRHRVGHCTFSVKLSFCD